MFLITKHIDYHYYIFNFLINLFIIIFSFILISYKLIIVFVYLYCYYIKLVFLIMLVLIMIQCLRFCYVMRKVMISSIKMIMGISRRFCWMKCLMIAKITNMTEVVNGLYYFCLYSIIRLIIVIRFLAIMCHQIILILSYLKIMFLSFIPSFYYPKTWRCLKLINVKFFLSLNGYCYLCYCLVGLLLIHYLK